jgi:YVTN family beta-propeller protein
VAVTPNGRKLYVANGGSNNVSVLLTDSPIPVGSEPLAFGKFIQSGEGNDD